MSDLTDRLIELGIEIETGDPDETYLVVGGKHSAESAQDGLGLTEAKTKPITETVRYYAMRDPDGTVLLVFRMYEDNVEKRLGFQRFVDGDWVDDPSLIDELREPGCRPISPDEAERILRS